MIKKFLIALLILFLLLLGTIYFYWQGLNSPADNKNIDMAFVIERGQGVKQISQNLEDSGLIKSKNYFEYYIWMNNFEKKLQAGVYNLHTGQSIKEIVSILIQGKAVSPEKSLTFIEGWGVKNMAEYLNSQDLPGNEFERLALSNWENLGAEKINKKEFFDYLPKEATLEGFLFPDTYRVYIDSQASVIINKILDNFDKKLTREMREEINKQNKSLYEIIIMASLIEKEVRSYEDMKIVSGVFWNRIKNGQALESCATLAYILGVNKPQYTQEDTKIDSFYNTYQNRGLPPGPICNPGLNAIKAAIYPQDTNYNYFLSRPDTGQTVFSVTYQEHLANKNRYLK